MSLNSSLNQNAQQTGRYLRTASHWLTLMKERVPESVSMRLPSPITVHDETEPDTAPGTALKKLLE